MWKKVYIYIYHFYDKWRKVSSVSLARCSAEALTQSHVDPQHLFLCQVFPHRLHKVLHGDRHQGVDAGGHCAGGQSTAWPVLGKLLQKSN